MFDNRNAHTKTGTHSSSWDTTHMTDDSVDQAKSPTVAKPQQRIGRCSNGVTGSDFVVIVHDAQAA